MSDTPYRSARSRSVFPLAREIEAALDGRCGGDLTGFVETLAAKPSWPAAPLPSLVIEEDPDDGFVLLRALSIGASMGAVRIVDSPPSAWRLLQKRGYKPGLIVLGLKAPLGRSGGSSTGFVTNYTCRTLPS